MIVILTEADFAKLDCLTSVVPTAYGPVIFDPITRESNDCINIARFNANSLPAHMHLLRAHFSSNFHDFNSISETWLHSLVPDNRVDLDDYLLIRKDRVSRRGGRVACCVHWTLRVNVLAASPSLFSYAPKYFILELKCPNDEALLFASVYRKPKWLLFNDFLNVIYSTFNVIYSTV